MSGISLPSSDFETLLASILQEITSVVQNYCLFHDVRAMSDPSKASAQLVPAPGSESTSLFPASLGP